MKVVRAMAAVVILTTACSGCEKETDNRLQEPPVEEAVPVAEETNEDIKTKRPEDNWLIHTIHKGEHHSEQSGFKFFEGDTLKFKFFFDSTAAYHTQDPVNQKDWNKLMGFSDCQSMHQQNSIRLVWRYGPELNQVEIGEYRYTSGERSFTDIGNIAIGDTNFARLVAAEDQYYIKLNHTELSRQRMCRNRTGSYWLYPYFGGDEVAPHDIHVHISLQKPVTNPEQLSVL